MLIFHRSKSDIVKNCQYMWRRGGKKGIKGRKGRKGIDKEWRWWYNKQADREGSGSQKVSEMVEKLFKRNFKKGIDKSNLM